MNKAPHADCDNCPLQSCKYVPSERLGSGSLAIVGEAPGLHEVQKGRPFVGMSGQLLRKTLDQLELTDRVGLITNVCLCRPANNATPTAEAVAACYPRLVAELNGSGCDTVVILGNTALEALLGEEHITQARGKRYKRDGFTFVPTIHPAAILRRSSMFPDFVEDLKRAAEAAPTLDKPESVIMKEEDLEMLADALLAHPLVACDIETSGYLAHQDRVLCISFAVDQNTGYVVPEELVTHPQVVRVLKEHRGLLFHNGKFDCLFLWLVTGVRPHIGHDTLLLHYTMDERRGTHGLKELVTSIFGVADWELPVFATLNKKSDSFANVPKHVLYSYAGTDACYTIALHVHLLHKAQADEWDRIMQCYKMLLDFANKLLPVERHGMLVDFDLLDRVDSEFTAVRDALYKRLEERAAERTVEVKYVKKIVDGKPRTVKKTITSIQPFNPNSPQQVAALLYDRLGLPQIAERGTNVEILNTLAARFPEVEVLSDIVEYRHVSKMQSTYVANIRELADARTLRVHPSFQLHGTETGRTAMSRPNLLNIPRTTKSDHAAKIRALFVAPPGHVILSADYSQAEMRVMAHLSGDEYLLEQFVTGADLHTAAAQRMFGVEKPNKEQRNVAKMFNFGLIYGRGAASVAEQLHIPVREAEGMLRTFFGLMPKVAAWIDETRKKVERGEPLITPFGRTRHFGVITPKNWHDIRNEAINFPVQSTSSDLTLSSLLELTDPEVLPPDWGAPLLMVHDNVLLEVLIERLTEVTEIVRRVMETMPLRAIGCTVPFKTDVSYGHSWGDT